MKSKTNIIVVLLLSLSLNSLAQTLEWAVRMGRAYGDEGNSLAIDASGNVYTIGSFHSTVDFDPGPDTLYLTATGLSQDIFVQKLDARGKFLWAKRFGNSDTEFGHSISVDSLGNVYTTGSFKYVVDFDPGPGKFNLTSVGIDDVFIQKLDSSGNFIWAVNFGGTNWDDGYSCVDVLGNVYTAGNFNKTVDFDPGPGTFNLTSNGFADIFIQKLDSSGNFVWAKQIGGTSQDLTFSIVLGKTSNVYITGFFKDIVDFDPGSGTLNLTSSGSSEIYVLKLDSSGNLVWAKQIGGTYEDSGKSIAVDNSENVYITGQFRDKVDFDPGPGIYNLQSFGNYDIFVQKLDASGNFNWTKQMGGTSSDEGISIAVDDSGNVYTTGEFYDTIDIDPGPDTVYMNAIVSTNEIFIQKLDSSGNFIWANQIGGRWFENASHITVNALGNVYTLGSFQDTVDFDPGPETYNLISAGGYDIFIQKLNQCIVTTNTISESVCNSYISPSGNKLWTTSGTYIDTILKTTGCDSIITINLTINKADTSVAQTGITLSANATGASYQWLDCNNGFSAITGETNQSYTPALTGSYAVEVTQNSCVDTSNCYDVTVVGIITNSFPGKIYLYPNPGDGKFTLDLGANYPNVSIVITDISGKQVYSKKFNNSNLVNINLDEPTGIYFLTVVSNKNKATFKLMKE